MSLASKPLQYVLTPCARALYEEGVDTEIRTKKKKAFGK